VPHDARLEVGDQFACTVWMLPTLPNGSEQTVVTTRDRTGAGWRLYIGTDRKLHATVTGTDGFGATATTTTKLLRGVWYFVALTYSALAHDLTLAVTHRANPLAPQADTALATVVQWGDQPPAPGGAPYLSIGAALATDHPTHALTPYNGKVAAPRLYDRCLPIDHALAEANRGPDHPALIAAYDFSEATHTRRVVDMSRSGLHGRTFQMPTRAVTGPHWTPRSGTFDRSPHHFDAIHFHDDDLDDASWEPTATWTVEQDLPSGIYAAEVTAGSTTDTIPIIVRPRANEPQHRSCSSPLRSAGSHTETSGRSSSLSLNASPPENTSSSSAC
jgi:N,N-dimethylformamidase